MNKTKMARTAPERIWLQVDTEDKYASAEAFPDDHEGITWCQDSVGGAEVEYVRGDLVRAYLTHTELSGPKTRAFKFMLGLKP